MPRYRDDDRDDRDDDRPRRRRGDDDGPPRKSNTGMILLIIGLAVGIPLLVCGGVVAYFVYVVGQVASSVKQGIEQVSSAAQADVAAGNFLTTLQFGNVEGAYQSTTANFKTTTSLDEFQKLVKANPVLTTTHRADTNGFPPLTGTAPNRRSTVIFTVNPDETGDEMNHVGRTSSTGPIQPGTGSKPTAPRSTAPAPKGVTCTITVAEQPDGTWKVDGFTIP